MTDHHFQLKQNHLLQYNNIYGTVATLNKTNQSTTDLKQTTQILYRFLVLSLVRVTTSDSSRFFV